MGIRVDYNRMIARMASLKLQYKDIEKRAKKKPSWAAQTMRRIKINGECEPSVLGDISAALESDPEDFMVTRQEEPRPAKRANGKNGVPRSKKTGAAA